MRITSGWENLPKGWTEESVQKFWDSLTGDRKHRVTRCISKMEDKIDNPGAFCASLADKVEGPGWRKKASYAKMSVATLPVFLKRALAEVRYQRRTLGWEVAHSYTPYSSGDDGNRGFLIEGNLQTKQYKITLGAWGGGALGVQPSAVDDTTTGKRPLTNNMVVIIGQTGSSPYAFLRCTPDTLPQLLPSKTASALAEVSPSLLKRVKAELLKQTGGDKGRLPAKVGGLVYFLYARTPYKSQVRAILERGPSMSLGDDSAELAQQVLNLLHNQNLDQVRLDLVDKLLRSVRFPKIAKALSEYLAVPVGHDSDEAASEDHFEADVQEYSAVWSKIWANSMHRDKDRTLRFCQVLSYVVGLRELSRMFPSPLDSEEDEFGTLIQTIKRLVGSTPTGIVVVIAGLLSVSGNHAEDRRVRALAHKLFPMEWR